MSMDIIVKCDRCTVATKFFNQTVDDAEKEVLKNGWAVQDFGYSCPICTVQLKEIDGLDSSTTSSIDSIVEALTEGLKK